MKTSYGTVDSKNLKSLYINLQTWVLPKDEYENWVRIVGNLSREIKHSVYESLNGELFHENFIVDLDLRTSGIQVGKKSFMNLEINLFTKNELDFKSTIVKDSVKKIITTSVDKSKLDAVFQKNLDETKEELKKINS